MKRGDEISVEEFRKMFGKGVSLANQAAKSAAQWREEMKKKSSKPKNDHVNDIRIMLTLAKIDFVEEHKFHPTRKWRFDFAIPEKMIGIEYEGLFSKKSGHTTIDGFLSDVEKYNEAVKLGWKILRYTVKSYKRVIEDIQCFM